MLYAVNNKQSIKGYTRHKAGARSKSSTESFANARKPTLKSFCTTLAVNAHLLPVGQGAKPQRMVLLRN